MKKILVALGLLLAGPVLGAQVAHPVLDTMPGRHHILVRPEIMDALGSLADTATVEHDRCLLGRAVATNGADTLYTVDKIYAPVAWRQEPGRVFLRKSCPLFTVSSWHNHILRVVKNLGRGPWFTTDTTGRAACFASTKDIQTGLAPDAPPLMTVQVNSRTFCWWTRDQLRAIQAAGALPIVLWPRADQLRTDWVGEEIERPRTGERTT